MSIKQSDANLPKHFSMTIIARSVAAAMGMTGASIASGQDEQSLALEEVVVTARKRTESTQDVPMHILSLTG